MQEDKRIKDLKEILKLIEITEGATRKMMTDLIEDIDQMVIKVNDIVDRDYKLIDLLKLYFLLEKVFPQLLDLLVKCNEVYVKNIERMAKEETKDITIN
jgi:hypothetical protein